MRRVRHAYFMYFSFVKYDYRFGRIPKPYQARNHLKHFISKPLFAILCIFFVIMYIFAPHRCPEGRNIDFFLMSKRIYFLLRRNLMSIFFPITYCTVLFLAMVLFSINNRNKNIHKRFLSSEERNMK